MATTFASYDKCYSVEQVEHQGQQQLLGLVEPESNIQLTRHSPVWNSTYNCGTEYVRDHGFALLGESLKAWHDCRVPSHVLAHDSVGSTALTGASTLSADQSLVLGAAYEALCDGTDGMRIYLALEQAKRARILDGPKLGMWVDANMGADYVLRLAKAAAAAQAMGDGGRGDGTRSNKRARVGVY